jgi:hypothetical protein
MKTLLRHATTGQYYQSSGKWTRNPERAYDFGLISQAVKFVRNTRCRNMELNLSFDNPQQAAAFSFKECLEGL